MKTLPLLSDLTLADIPPMIGLFPLFGTLLLPKGKLPLNVFEPRYITLMEDALKTHRLVGIIQPRTESYEDDFEEGITQASALYSIGCIGRITSFTERSDGSMAVTLTGIIRFRLLRYHTETSNYLRAYIDSSGYGADFLESTPFFCTKKQII